VSVSFFFQNQHITKSRASTTRHANIALQPFIKNQRHSSTVLIHDGASVNFMGDVSIVSITQIYQQIQGRPN
jgi:hypothetical protein